MLLVYDINKQESNIYSTINPIVKTPIYIYDNLTVDSSVTVFDKTFRSYDRQWLLGASYHLGFDCLTTTESKKNIFLIIEKWFPDLYYTQMKMDFIHHIRWKCMGKDRNISQEFYVKHVFPDIYKEFSPESQALDNGTM